MIFFLLLPTYSGIIPAREILLPSGVLLSYFFFQELRRLNFEYWWEVDCLGVMLFTFTRHHPTYNSSYNFITHTCVRAYIIQLRNIFSLAMQRAVAFYLFFHFVCIVSLYLMTPCISFPSVNSNLQKTCCLYVESPLGSVVILERFALGT